MVAWLLSAGCASAPAGDATGDDASDDASDDSTTPDDAAEAGRDGHGGRDSTALDTGVDSLAPAEASMSDAGDDSTTTTDSPSGDDGTTPDANDSGGQPDTSGPVDSGSAVDANDGATADTGVDSGPDASTGPITFVQSAAALVTGTATAVPVTFAQAQKAGDLIVIAVGWTDTTPVVSSVKDSAGNTYHLAVGPTQETTDLTQSIYYAAGIAAASAGSNKLTVTFSVAANGVDLRAAEYAGLSATSPLDVTATAAGKSSAANSGSKTTTVARELLFGAGMTTDGYNNTPTTGFTMRGVTNNGDMFEDRVVSATGAYAASGTFNDTGSWEWVMQLATFR